MTNSEPPFTIRQAEPTDFSALGELTVGAYKAVPGTVSLPDYDSQLRDVATRAAQALVLVAADDQGRVLGGVTYVPGPGVMAELAAKAEAEVRMLAVRPDAQRQGVGAALVRACIDRARQDRRTRIVLLTAPWAPSDRLYLRLGLVRTPRRDRPWASGGQQFRMNAYTMTLRSGGAEPAVSDTAAVTHQTYQLGDTNIGDYLLSARSFSEYRAMLSITDDDLKLRILDCPGGGSSFTATASSLGVDAMAVDPAYATPAADLGRQVITEVERGSAWALANTDRYVWSFYADPGAHRELRAKSARLFAQDLLAHPERYRAGKLPSLPFADGSFDLVLSSHLLFTYADRLDLAFHRAAIVELARVSRHEVRIFPLVDQADRDQTPLVDSLTTELADHGLTARQENVGYEFQRGADRMLVVMRASDGISPLP